MKKITLILLLFACVSANAQKESFVLNVEIDQLPGTNLRRVVENPSLVVDGNSRRAVLECIVHVLSPDSVELPYLKYSVNITKDDSKWVDSLTGNPTTQGASRAVTEFDFFVQVGRTGTIAGQDVTTRQLRIIAIMKAKELGEFNQ